MNHDAPHPEPLPPDTERDRHVESAVRSYLEADARIVNPQAMLTKIRGRLAIVPAPPEPRRPSLWPRLLGYAGGLIAASVVLYFLLIPGPEIAPPRTITAAELVKEAKIAHETTIEEFCYEVEADWDIAPFSRAFPFRPIIRKATLWTRKNEFFVQTQWEDQRLGDRTWSWGQEASGKVWIAPYRKRVLIYDPDEMNEPLARFCDLMSLRLASTLAELLDTSDMNRVDGNEPGEPIRIDARARVPKFLPPTPRIVRAELELDAKTKKIRKAVLHRQAGNEPIGRIVFTLKNIDHRQPEVRYTYRGHVDSNAEVIVGPKLPSNVPRWDQNDPRIRARDEWLRLWKAMPPP